MSASQSAIMPLEESRLTEGEEQPRQKRSSLAQKARSAAAVSNTTASANSADTSLPNTTSGRSGTIRQHASRQEHHPYQRRPENTNDRPREPSEAIPRFPPVGQPTFNNSHSMPSFPPSSVTHSGNNNNNNDHYRHRRGGGSGGGHPARTNHHHGQHYHPYARPQTAIRAAGNAAHVADHYNRHQQQSHEQRQQSLIYRLRSFNNWIKSVLIAHTTKQCQTKRVLDMGCGKGGDLLKWTKARIDYLAGVDIASVSVEQARGRWTEIRHNRFNADFYALDCYENPLAQVIPLDEKFDMVSQQFCLHYAFETEHKARQMVKNVADYLRPGGRWIGTLPDAYWITKKLQSIDGLKFGNSVYYIEFDQKTTFPTYGHRYVFHLEDAIESCPEYLVHFPTLVKLAQEQGLQLVQRTPFHQYYEKFLNDSNANQLLRRMKVIGDNGEGLSRDEWEVAGAYLVFEFIRIKK